MRRAFHVCALCAALSVFSAADCGKNRSAGTGKAGARSNNSEVAAGKGSNPASPSAVENPSDPFAKIPRMAVAELKKALDEGRAVAADVRPPEAFEEGHIEGALSVPEEDWAAHVEKVPKDKLVVTYCA